MKGGLLFSKMCLLRECAVYHLLNCVSAVPVLCHYLDNSVVISNFIHEQMVFRLDLEWRMRF